MVDPPSSSCAFRLYVYYVSSFDCGDLRRACRRMSHVQGLDELKNTGKSVLVCALLLVERFLSAAIR